MLNETFSAIFKHLEVLEPQDSVEVLIYANGILKWSWSCPRATEIASADAQFLFRSALNTSKKWQPE